MTVHSSNALNTVAWTVWLMHASYARGLLADPTTLGITSVLTMTRADDAAAVYIVVCMIAIPAMVLRQVLPLWFKLLLLVPQQLLLFLSLESILTAIRGGVYKSGTALGGQFIATDQGVYVILAVVHTFCMLWPLLQNARDSARRWLRLRK